MMRVNLHTEYSGSQESNRTDQTPFYIINYNIRRRRFGSNPSGRQLPNPPNGPLDPHSGM